ncbi:MAG TPA: hypothetical protein HA306_05895 [Methanosarcina sp.]|nr:hypothetical protein [Methanosarcina sp.]
MNAGRYIEIMPEAIEVSESPNLFLLLNSAAIGHRFKDLKEAGFNIKKKS